MKHPLLILLSLASTALAYEALQGPTELLYWDKTNAYPGYTWFGVRTKVLLEPGTAPSICTEVLLQP